MMWDHDHGSNGHWIGMAIFMVVFWAAIAALVVVLVRSSGMRSHPPTGTSDDSTRAQDVLAERFARGEIDEEEFTRRRALLRSP